VDFSNLKKSLGITFQNPDFLKQALTHRSYLNENRRWSLEHNERLEFLGDAVLEMIVTDYLFGQYPGEPEGKLTEYRSTLVNIKVLSTLAREIGMNDFLLLSRGESKDTGRARELILGNAFEAVIGALYIDQGYDTARDFVTTHLLNRSEEFIAQGLSRNTKSKLQEVVQEQLKVTPTYAVLEESGPDHDKRFVVGVYFGSDLIAQGEGGAKRLAEEKAAKAALILRGWIPTPTD